MKGCSKNIEHLATMERKNGMMKGVSEELQNRSVKEALDSGEESHGRGQEEARHRSGGHRAFLRCSERTFGGHGP